jgi:hypothetical protein
LNDWAEQAPLKELKEKKQKLEWVHMLHPNIAWMTTQVKW